SPALFRPPHGKLTARKMLGLWREGLSIVLWNVDPRDYRLTSAEELRAWFHVFPPRAGDIVLLHDDRAHTAGAVGEIVALGRARGLTFTTPLACDRGSAHAPTEPPAPPQPDPRANQPRTHPRSRVGR